MFVADKAQDLSAGTLYAAKWNQTSASNGGRANLTWVKLGHSTDADVKALADTETFNSIFNNQAMNADGTCPAGLTRIRSGSTFDECLSTKAGKETAAAFLETRRYAALLGATTEFNKMEGVAVNAADKKLYLAMSYIDKGMLEDGVADNLLADHIKLAKLNAGATYTIALKSGLSDTANNAIHSDYVGSSMAVENRLLGRDLAQADTLGNTADPNFIANTDNLFFAEKMRTLFIGEDSGMHINNFVWAYNVDTQKLTRILSLVSGAEATGLQVVEELDGYAYIMSNSQHHGDYLKTLDATKKAEMEAIGIPKMNAGDIGYIGGLPAIK
jgi:secreted PhoX family phosphatase